jgi:D-glycero-beta-D-manno-heptose-7-phosphate kinase
MREILDRFPGRRLLVLGDLMLDQFIWGEVRRISPEAPVPVVEVRRESYHLGGAGNVVSNLLELGAAAAPVGVVGDDWAGAELRRRCAELGAETAGISTDASRPTTLKTRIVAHSQQVVRADREARGPVSRATEEAVIAHFAAALPGAEVVIVSDYDKGLLTPRVLAATLGAAREARKPVCLDPKIRHFAHYRGVDVVTPNQQEAERAAGVEITGEASLLEAGARIRAQLDCGHVLITRGEHGMSLLNASGKIAHIPTVAREVYDVTGAGDTVIAALALALSAGAGITAAAVIANYAAGVVVGKVGTATVSRAELAEAIAREHG